MTLRLHFRNRLAVLYGFLFPLIFLAAFWALYRHEKIPLLLHMGELLAVTVLSGACFSLPTTLVSERERGVWQRYRLAPIATPRLVLGSLLARIFLIAIAGALQLVLALAVGMTAPAHPLALLLVFTVVSFAFASLGLVIAALADSVPAVQALGQCLFLPMLILGGVAVPLSSLPHWAQHLSAYLPGRYAIESLQTTVNGDGLPSAQFDLIVLGLIGVAACLTGAKLFRWTASERFRSLAGKAWLIPTLGAWLIVGTLAEIRDHLSPKALPNLATSPTTTAPNLPPQPWELLP